MAAVMPVSFENFQDEFLRAKESLKDVDENIKKLTGRDPKLQRKRKPGDPPPNFNAKDNNRNQSSFPGSKRERKDNDEDKINSNRRFNSAFSRLSSREDSRRRNQENSEDEEEDQIKKPSLQSSIVSTPNQIHIKTRKDSLNELKNDTKVMARNRRMFGLLVGTLQKFQSEQTQQRDKEEKRHRIEEKLEKKAVKEKEEVQKERRDLFLARREKQDLLKNLERKMNIAKSHEEWEKRQNYFLGFIKTKASPSVMYLPAKSTPASEILLKESAIIFQSEIKAKRKEMEEEIQKLDNYVKRFKGDMKFERKIVEKSEEEEEEEEGNDNANEQSDSINNELNTETKSDDLPNNDEGDVKNICKDTTINENNDNDNSQELAATEPEFEPMYD